jgi:phage I-like protein
MKALILTFNKGLPVRAHAATDSMEEEAVLARAVPLAAEAAAGEFVYMPPGRNEIEATVNGKPQLIEVIVDASTADRLQADLAKRLEGPVEPFLDYNHEGGRASGHPQGFRWDPARGVICQNEWTTTARSAIRDREWKYFSPEFRYDPKTKTVLGLRRIGPLGGLVNDPAFRAIGAVTARRAGGGASGATDPDKEHTPSNPTPTDTTRSMEKNIVAALIAAGILTQTEAAGEGAPSLVTARIADLKAGGDTTVKAAHASTLKAKDERITELETEIKASKTAAAKTAVDAAVKAGRIPAKDEATRKFWEESIADRGEDAAKALLGLPVAAAFNPTSAGSTEEVPEEKDKQEEAEADAIQARAVAIAAERKIPFGAAWEAAGAEVKAARRNLN